MHPLLNNQVNTGLVFSPVGTSNKKPIANDQLVYAVGAIVFCIFVYYLTSFSGKSILRASLSLDPKRELQVQCYDATTDDNTLIKIREQLTLCLAEWEDNAEEKEALEQNSLHAVKDFLLDLKTTVLKSNVSENLPKKIYDAWANFERITALLPDLKKALFKPLTKNKFFLICKDEASNNIQAIAFGRKFDLSKEIRLSFLITNPDNIRSKFNDSVTTKVQGAGSAILNYLKASLSEDYKSITLIPTESAKEFYFKRGFERITAHSVVLSYKKPSLKKQEAIEDLESC